MSVEQEFSAEERRKSVLEAFRDKGDFPAIMDEKTLESLLDAVIELDEAYMAESGANDGAVYDDDAAYDYMHAGLCGRFPDYRAYMMRFVEDYLEYNEAYLESVGLIDWE